MDSVKVRKDVLHSNVRANRDKHHAAFKTAFEGYRLAVIEALESALEEFRAGRAERFTLNELPPKDHTKDYDRLLAMLDMSVDEEITLSATAFAQYIEDDWAWKADWIAINAKYLGR